MRAIGDESKKRERWEREGASESEGESVEVKKEVYDKESNP